MSGLSEEAPDEVWVVGTRVDQPYEGAFVMHSVHATASLAYDECREDREVVCWLVHQGRGQFGSNAEQSS